MTDTTGPDGSTADASTTTGSTETAVDVDAVVVGAGFAGLYMVHRLHTMGFTVQGLERAEDIGGTWFWNRYPGARCDIESVDYQYSFDPELEAEWQWSEKYATQPEILAYADHVANKHDLRRHFRFSVGVAAATWDDGGACWRVTTTEGDTLAARHLVMATGCLSQPKLPPDVPGIESFAGPIYYTSTWPHEGVDFTGMRVGVIGTGSSGIQSIPIIAEQASELTVFQRTPNFSVPARNGDHRPVKLAAVAEGRDAYREAARWSRVGVPLPDTQETVVDADEAERNERFERAWEAGTILDLLTSYSDIQINPVSNDIVAEFVRNKIRAVVDDAETAEELVPTEFPIGTKRLCLDTGYYETFNQPHVSLVNLRKTPITTVTETGIETEAGHREFDALVLATGFDALTGAAVAVDLEGRDGRTLKQHWADGPVSYLGLTAAGFPNLYLITGPQSPSVLSNMMVSIEQHVDWVADTIGDLRDRGLGVIEATPEAEAGWVQHTNDYGDITLFSQADSWYMGANMPGKPRRYLMYVGGVDTYRTICDEVRAGDYVGFSLGPADGTATVTRTSTEVIRRVQPDAQLVLDGLAEAEAPPFESMEAGEARVMFEGLLATLPPGPEVGEEVDGTFPGPGGPLAYRLFRPPTEGPHPVVVYYHGGGWVLGTEQTDAPLCRDLCLQADAVIVSCDYRHAPEHRFPAAADDAVAALQWVADNVEALGGRPGPVAVCGWSAGGNLAAVVAQAARDLGGPPLAGQVLITPVTDADTSRPSFVDNAEGYFLTAATMEWFWDHYTDADQRSDPRVSPLRGELSGLAPALVVTAEFDPLRDEGNAYAEALRAAGNEVELLQLRGQIHTSLAMVDVIISAAGSRSEVARALRRMLEVSVAA